MNLGASETSCNMSHGGVPIPLLFSMFASSLRKDLENLLNKLVDNTKLGKMLIC